MNAVEEPFWGKTLRLIREIWVLGETEELKERVRADLPDSDFGRLREAIDACLEGRGGEVSARARAAELGRTYLVLDSVGRQRFLKLLAREYGVDNGAVDQAIQEREAAIDPEDRYVANLRLRNLLEPPRARLFRQFNELEDGVKFLVDLRAELLALIKTNPELRPLDQDVQRLLTSWFDIGFLDLQRITWATSATVLEKLILYESVHAISSWKDLKNRLRDDRRCYAFFHPKMACEPLIFVEVALVNGIAGNVEKLLDVEAPVRSPEKADTAIFYSISNCQQGLTGVSFGNFLIKRVVADLAAKLPNLKTFSTLSPIPGFIDWLASTDAIDGLNRDEQELWDNIMIPGQPVERIREILLDSAEPQPVLQEMLMQCCARYLVEAKRGRQALNRVAHFHLSNGAQIERINWRANLSEQGIEQSAGIMVNYLYKLSQIEKNHELYTGSGEIAVSSSVRKLLKR
ncbi:MAG: malonyl-CoA decarboxylase [Desulfopila sp.]